MEQEAVRFWSEGEECAGTLYLPDGAAGDGVPDRVGDGGVPGIVMGHGFASVKEMALLEVAGYFAQAGMAALAVDYRHLGESGGEPRQLVSPHEQVKDLKNAVGWLSGRPEVDAERVGLWGTSLGGGNVLRAAAFDRRVNAVVSQVPGLSVWRILEPGTSQEERFRLLRMLAEDRERRQQAGGDRQAYARVPISALEGEFSALGPTDLEWHERTEREVANFRNEVVLASLEEVFEADAGAFIDAISPTPLLMILGEEDTTTPPEFAREAFVRAGEPKKLLTYEGNHYRVYDDPETLRFAAEAACDWFVEHLAVSVPAAAAAGESPD